MSDSDSSLKLRTARSVKWSAIDRLASQVLYAVTGIVLARLLPPADFGLVGAALIFQAFASLLIDSGFSYALIQRKNPTRLDYSSVLWFNMGISCLLYIGLWFGAPLIADCFQHDMRLVPIARAIFVTMILNASAIVQINQLTKQMHLRPVAVANIVSLALGGALGIWLALEGYGVWAIVWQAIANSGIKSLMLWITSKWLPLLQFSWSALRSFFSVGGGMMFTSFLNTVFLNIYSFFIGNQAGMTSLGYYTQSDKWSKMGITSISQTLTSSFLPPLSAAQDDKGRFLRLCHKMNRVTAYVLFPAMLGLAVMASTIFHTLFGPKWDLSIALFQLLLIRGIFTVLNGLYTNYLLALGRTRLIVGMEALRDSVAIIALLATLPWIAVETPADPTFGIRLMIYGQILASIIAWIVTLIKTCIACSASVWSFCYDLLPYLALTLLICPVLWWINELPIRSILVLCIQAMTGCALYLLANWLFKSRIQSEAIEYVFGRFRHKT